MSRFTVISYNIKTNFILCSFHLCCQNSSDTLRQSHKFSGGVKWCLALGHWQWILGVLWVGAPIRLVRLGSEEFRDQISALGSWSCSSGHPWPGFVVLQGTLSYWGATAIEECCCWEIVYVVYISVWVGGMFQVLLTWRPRRKVSQENIAL